MTRWVVWAACKFCRCRVTMNRMHRRFRSGERIMSADRLPSLCPSCGMPELEAVRSSEILERTSMRTTR